MEAKAKLTYLRISPRKVQIVLDLIRGKDVATAAAILMQTPKAASEPVLKLLKSAAANAENNHGMDPSKLYVSTCLATPGPLLIKVNIKILLLEMWTLVLSVLLRGAVVSPGCYSVPHLPGASAKFLFKHSNSISS